MPIQNAGTLLENIVLLEAARTLSCLDPVDEHPLDFINAFVLPPTSEWRGMERYAYQVGLGDSRLDHLSSLKFQENDTSYPSLLQRCLRADRKQGPNGALLVGMMLRQSGRSCRMWLNDLAAGEERYVGTTSGLGQLRTVVDDLCKSSLRPARLDVKLCTTPYPDSLADLETNLSAWCRAKAPVGRLGFLDPDMYSLGERIGPQTS